MIEAIIKSSERYSDLWVLTKELMEAFDVDVEDDGMPDYMREAIIRHGLHEEDEE